MFPMPIISNTYVNQLDDLDRLRFEIQANNWPRATLLTDQPYVAPFNNALIVYFTGSFMNVTGSSIMWGSPWGTKFTYDSYFIRIFQHSFPDNTILQYYKNNPDTPALFFRTAFTTYPSYDSVNRNGYVSYSYSSYQGSTNTLFVYYDPSTQRVMQYDPSTLSTPVFRYN